MDTMKNSYSLSILDFMTRIVTGAVILTLLVIALRSQASHTLKPWSLRARDAAFMLNLPDREKLAALAPAYANLIREIRRYPAGTRFYFVPCFADSGNTGLWWWYVYLLSRYYSYPNQLLIHDSVLYNDRKDIYMERFISGSRTFNDLPWVKERKIEQIILMRNNQVQILPTTTEIRGL